MTANPPPRPALRRTPDGTIVTAASAVPARSHGVTPTGLGKKLKPSKDDVGVELVVKLPKSVRKRLRKKAAAHGCTAEEAAARLIAGWLGDG